MEPQVTSFTARTSHFTASTSWKRRLFRMGVVGGKNANSSAISAYERLRLSGALVHHPSAYISRGGDAYVSIRQHTYSACGYLGYLVHRTSAYGSTPIEEVTHTSAYVRIRLVHPHETPLAPICRRWRARRGELKVLSLFFCSKSRTH